MVRRLVAAAILAVLNLEARAQEACGNGADDDADGQADCLDHDCGLDMTCCSGWYGWDPPDADGDGWCDRLDGCVVIASIAQDDSDGDGTPDLCDACPGLQGDGLALFGSRITVSDLGDEGRGVDVADLDGDGDIDVLSASGIRERRAPPSCCARIVAHGSNTARGRVDDLVIEQGDT